MVKNKYKIGFYILLFLIIILFVFLLVYLFLPKTNDETEYSQIDKTYFYKTSDSIDLSFKICELEKGILPSGYDCIDIPIVIKNRATPNYVDLYISEKSFKLKFKNEIQIYRFYMLNENYEEITHFLISPQETKIIYFRVAVDDNEKTDPFVLTFNDVVI